MCGLRVRQAGSAGSWYGDAISGQPGPPGPIVLTPAINVFSTTASQPVTSKLTVLKAQ